MIARWFRIRPLDVCLFRDGRPFSGGDSHQATSLYPPYPSVAYGALRAVGFVTHEVRLGDFAGTVDKHPAAIRAYGTPTGPGRFRLEAFLPALGTRPVFPAPAALFREKEESRERPILRGAPLDGEIEVRCSLPAGLRPVWVRSREILDRLGGFVTSEGMEAFLRGGTPEPGFFPNGDFVARVAPPLPPGANREREAALVVEDNRFGIARDPAKRTVKTGFLYQALFLGFPGDDPETESGFLAAVSGDEEAPLPDHGFLRFGGESRPAFFEEVEAALPAAPSIRDRFTWVLATPAVFDNGWLPGQVHSEGGKYLLEREGFRARLVGAAVPPALPVGGWDIAARAPKPIRQAVPSGSTYFFELENGDPGAVLRDHGTCLADVGAEEGFGLTLIGAW